MMQKKTPLGTLVTTYKQDSIYPGFYVDLRHYTNKGKDILPVCNVEYNYEKECIQVIVYGNTNIDEPTDIIDINLPYNKKGE